MIRTRLRGPAGTSAHHHGTHPRGAKQRVGSAHLEHQTSLIAFLSPHSQLDAPGQFDWSPDFLDDFDVNVTVLPPGSSAFIVGDDYD